jgi:predicted  nucleic acid-binding Zn ribbon protein
MLLASVSFIPHVDHEEAELVAVAEAHLGTLLKNGQICGRHVAGWSQGAYHAFVYLSHRNASDNRYLSQWGQQTLASIVRHFGAEPFWEILDDEVSQRTATWKSAKSFYLFAHFMNVASPVFHGGRATPLPLHLLPVSERLREELYDWGESSRCHDRVFLESGALELPAYEQLASPHGELAKHGRVLATDVETATGIPTYLYLLRHWAHPADEDNRPCPSCGRPWREKKSPMPSKEPFQLFHFRCETCRLVSHRGVVFEDNEHWKIGMASGDAPTAE